MSSSPYPGYPPSYTNVNTIGGYSRTCYAIEVRSLGNLGPDRRAVLFEQLELAVAQVAQKFADVESVELIPDSRFDKMLRDGFRLPP